MDVATHLQRILYLCTEKNLGTSYATPIRGPTLHNLVTNKTS